MFWVDVLMVVGVALVMVYLAMRILGPLFNALDGLQGNEPLESGSQTRTMG